METFSPSAHPNQEPLKMLSNYLYEDPADPHQLVREVREYSTQYNAGREIDRGATFDQISAALRANQGLYEELESRFGIRNAGFRPSIGNSPIDGQLVGFVRSMKIDGYSYAIPKGSEAFEDVDERKAKITLLPEHKPAARTLLDKLTDYYVDNSLEEKDFLDDVFSLDQYMYTDPSPEQPDGEMILADTEPAGYEGGEIDISVAHARKNLLGLAQKVLEQDELEQWQQKLDAAVALKRAELE